MPTANLNKIIDRYARDRRVDHLADLLAKEHQSIQLRQIAGAQECFILSALFQKQKSNHIYIANTKEEAAYVYNSLVNIEICKPHFFPDSFKRPLFFEEIDGNNSVERTECSHYIKDFTSSAVIVTYPEALFEKIVDPEFLNANKMEINVGNDLDLDFLIEVLISYGFTRTDFVYEPGNFSIRGGIIDIFNFGHEWPFRIELFDTEIESIRKFNPSTQLSVESTNKLSIIPNINSKFKREQKVALFKLFSAENTTVWLSGLDDVLEKLQLCFDKAKDFSESLESKTNEEIREVFEEIAFVYPHEIMEDIARMNKIFFNPPTGEFAGPGVEFGGRPQPVFNKNFSLLIDDLKKNAASGFENFIFTDSTKQIERFYSIFEDLGAEVSWHPVNTAMHGGFVDDVLKVACYTDHQIFERFHRYKLRNGFTKDMAINLKMLRELEPGDFVVHMDHGIGKYSGLEKIDINGHVQESVRLIYSNNDILYVSINSLHKISKYVGKDGTAPALSKIGGEAWKNLKRKTKSKVKDIAKELIKLYAKRKASEGFAFAPDSYLQDELEASFLYEDTPDQAQATQDVKEDMMKPHPMDRLICGDVGFGKTEVAIRAAFKAVISGKQVAILVPTTILALQHQQTFSKWLKDFGVTVDYLNRFRSAKEKKEILKAANEGKVDILIGTHAILTKELKFKDLGLLVIDEEQKFGVTSKEKLRQLKVNVDTLTLSATPIPRTLQFSLMAARDLSIIRTPPPNRQPIHTERRIFSEALIKEAIYYEVNRGGQVFFVHNRVKTLPEVTEMVQRMCPDVKIRSAHGQMESDHLEKTLVDFIEGEFDVLISTNIIETGLDIPNANTIIINNAHQFGLADLHQLRGRVGRSNTKAFCYLFAPPLSVLTDDARKRIKTLEEFSDLGSGFNIAMKDMDIRGAGNLLGSEQSGFIADIGYETFQKILEEAVSELKETDFKELFQEEFDKKKEYVRDVEIDTDIEMLIPDAYVTNIPERLSLYTELDGITNEEEIEAFRNRLKDRFGPVPKVIEELFSGLRIRWMCKKLGFERVSLKNNKLRCFFISNAQSSYFESNTFQATLAYVAGPGVKKGYSLKQTSSYLIMIKEGIKTLEKVYKELETIYESTQG